MGEQSAQGHQNVQIAGDVRGSVSVTFAGQPMPELAPAGVVKLRFGIPPRLAAFTGRGDELDALERTLTAEGRALVTQAITGLGGVGKTQLAARYVHTHGEEYAIVAWIHTEDGAVVDLATLAVKLGERVEGLSPTERRDLALERLARGEERWLLVLDALPAQELFDTSPEASYTQTVASTWRASIAAAGASAPLAGEVLALAAHLAPDAIPRSLFDVVIDPSRALEQKRQRDALNALARFSLATVDDETISVHRLLQKVVRDDARARGDASAVQRALAALDDAFPDDPSDAARWALCEQLLTHLIALADAAAGVPDTAVQTTELLNRAYLYFSEAEGGARGLARAQSTSGR